ncbi:MAG: rhomboid family intramembrane serine protease [Pseudonocardiaceae bacterium]
MPVLPPESLARPRVLPARPGQAAMIIAAFTGLLYLTEAMDMVLGGALDQNGILPRQLEGLDGVLWAPLLHDGWPHLVANTVPVLVFGFLALAGGIGQFVAVTATIWLVGGLGTWLTGSPGVHLGASGLIFGWLVFLLVRGFFARSLTQILLAVVLFGVWGSVLWGVLPGDAGISWEGHLFGAVGGLLAARLVARPDRPRPDQPRPDQPRPDQLRPDRYWVNGL